VIFGVGSAEDVVEADEMFFAESFKGTKPSKMTRKYRKRGKQVKKRVKFNLLKIFHWNISI
jgi:hypothetical protein